MEILEIRSARDMTASSPEARRVGVHSYQVNCRQFISVHRTWQNDKLRRAAPLSVMTLSCERIWMTEEESKQVAAAIQATRSPVAID